MCGPHLPCSDTPNKPNTKHVVIKVNDSDIPETSERPISFRVSPENTCRSYSYSNENKAFTWTLLLHTLQSGVC